MLGYEADWVDIDDSSAWMLGDGPTPQERDASQVGADRDWECFAVTCSPQWKKNICSPDEVGRKMYPAKRLPNIGGKPGLSVTQLRSGSNPRSNSESVMSRYAIRR
jgi:hypothetical protein